MANTLDLKLVLKHLSNGTLSENLCIICLMPLQQRYENIFTTICKQDKEYCIADVLQTLCQIEVSNLDNYNVCFNCFMMASMAYKFYLQSKRSNEILNFYSNELLNNLNVVELPEETTCNSLCISLPEIMTETPVYDFNLHSIVNKPDEIKRKIEKYDVCKIQKEKIEDDYNVVVVIRENGEPSFYRVISDGNLVLVNEDETGKYKQAFTSGVIKEGQPKKRRKRQPMSLKLCTRCPVRYRFIAKLKEHMKQEHNVYLYVCKVCKAVTEDEQDYHTHLKTHTNIHQCALCNTVFKKRNTIINHLKWHERMKNISKAENAHICEVCGVILENEESLRQHSDSKHYKKFTCYYCGRMYKGEMSFDMHIKKHEANMFGHKQKPAIPMKSQKPSSPSEKKANSKKCMCSTCGRYFVDERALLWHQRLHNNERPYTCDLNNDVNTIEKEKKYETTAASLLKTDNSVCGRGFVSVNRRNQHALCAHTAPTRRCPLCPALFHLRSMVNTHIKKVHLKAHKRRNRISKHQNVYWRTETVPIQELSVDIQNDILELQAATNHQEWIFPENGTPMKIEEM